MIKAEEIGKHLDVDRLVSYLLDEPWHKDCTIIPDYVALFDKDGARPKLVVFFEFDDHKVFLRHSKGPRQHFFWDIYGDDLQKMELALIALSQAPMPQRAMWSTKIPLDPVEKPTEENDAKRNATTD